MRSDFIEPGTPALWIVNSVNAAERALRPAVIQRKVTNGFRSMWAAQGDCAVRTVIDTAKITGQTPFQTITATLA